jgi:hypothetical protein
VRASSSGRFITQKVVGRSRNRGRKDHRILRRVPPDRRRLGSPPASLFTKRCNGGLGKSVTPPTHVCDRKGAHTASPRRRTTGEARSRATETSEARSLVHRGKKMPALDFLEDREVQGCRGSCWREQSPCAKWIRRSGSDVVKTSVSPVTTTQSLILCGVSALRKWREELGTSEVRVHASRSGGRSRSDVSRVFGAGRSQGLVELEGASREEAR